MIHDTFMIPQKDPEYLKSGVFKTLGPAFGGPAENLPPQLCQEVVYFFVVPEKFKRWRWQRWFVFFLLFLCGLKTTCAQKTGNLFWGKGAVGMFWIYLLMSQYILYIYSIKSVYICILFYVFIYFLEDSTLPAGFCQSYVLRRLCVGDLY